MKFFAAIGALTIMFAGLYGVCWFFGTIFRAMGVG